MATYIAFLRAINVGGRRVPMDDLVAQLASLPGFEVRDVATYLASGNVSFVSDAAPAELEQGIAAHLEDVLGYDVPTIIRSLPELESLAASDMFSAEAMRPNHKLYVTFVATPLDEEQRAALHALSNDVDTFELVDRDVFWLRDVDAGESMINADVEKALGVVGTRRTINTIHRIIKKLS